MSLISFGWTYRELLLGKKTVTRRTWKDSHARQFKAGDTVQAWSRGPHRKGRHIADIVVESVARERAGDMPDDDLALEGGRWPSVEDFVSMFPQGPDTMVWVMRFRVVGLTPEGQAMKKKLERPLC
jgi:hypothetical protein